MRGDDLKAGPRFHLGDFSTTPIQVADDITHVVFWCDSFNFHNGFKQNRTSLLSGIAESQSACNLE